jgi:hypothetical protein
MERLQFSKKKLLKFLESNGECNIETLIDNFRISRLSSLFGKNKGAIPKNAFKEISKEYSDPRMLREGSWLHILNELEKEGFITITHDRKWIRLNKIK